LTVNKQHITPTRLQKPGRCNFLWITSEFECLEQSEQALYSGLPLGLHRLTEGHAGKRPV